MRLLVGLGNPAEQSQFSKVWRAMQLLVGLGNPGPRFAGNRHNIGFMAVEAIARRHRIGPWRRRFRGVAAEGPIDGERVVLLLPETYMNDSGLAAGEAAHFYKLAVGHIVVFHDEIDLAPAKVRVKTGGGVAGHNGLRSISAHVGNDYVRVRVGIGHPGVKEQVYSCVLGDFAVAERPWVEALCDIMADNAAVLVKGGAASFQNKVHLAMQAKGFADVAMPGRPANKDA
jgi:PTH1 family peptidyl-tRNA hydrolase